MGKAAGFGCFVLLAFSVLVIGAGGLAKDHGFVAEAPQKKFVVIDEWPKARSGGLGWWWPRQLANNWLQDPIPVGTALEVRGEDAISVYTTGFSGERRRVILKFHNQDANYSPAPTRDDRRLVGHHVAFVPWNPATNAPACLERWSAVRFLAWPPQTFLGVALLFGIVAGLKILDCFGKGDFEWIWSLVFYAALLAPTVYAVVLKTRSRDLCEPSAAAFAAHYVREAAIRPLPAAALAGPWMSDSRIVIMSQACFLIVILLALRLLWPAGIGLHYLFVPHPAEAYVQRRRGKAAAIDVPGFRESLGQESMSDPPPEFVLRNKTRRIRGLANLFRAEREAAEEAIRHERATRARDDE